MRFAIGRAAALVFLSGLLYAAPSPSAALPSPNQVLKSVPMRFEADAQGRWTSRGAGFAFLFDRHATLLHVGGRTIELTFEGANSDAAFDAAGPSPVRTNYFVGKSYRSATAFSTLRRAGVYPGIDVVYYGKGGSLEYDFNLAPGADPSRIRMRFEGADRVSVNDHGEISLDLGANGQVVQQLPQVYQRRASGELVAVPAAYRRDADGSIRLKLGKYDRGHTLVIDPSLVFTAYLGGAFADSATAIDRDSQGFLYLAGYTYSTDFDEVGNTIEPFPTVPGRNCWLMKLNPQASDPSSVILYSTYFGGNLDTDLRGMTVDANGRMYFDGVSLSPDLATTSNAYLTQLPNTLGVNSAFGAILDPTIPGTAGLVYCSYFGSASATVDITGVANSRGRIYMTGWTQADDLPMTSLAFQTTRAGGYEGFVSILDPSQSGSAGLYYSTYIGGFDEDIPRSIATDSSGVLYVAGLTLSPDFFTTANALQPAYDVGGDGFLTEINPATGAVPYSTFIGGSDEDVVTKVYVEPSGKVAVAGYTFSTDFYHTANAVQSANGGNCDAFVTELDLTKPGLTGLLYSTYYGGKDAEVAYDMRRDAHGFFYLAGYTLSPNLPVTANAINPVSASGGVDGFVAVINPASGLLYSSYITSPGYQIAYGVDYDSAGNVYVAGLAAGVIFQFPPKSEGASNYDGFLMVISIADLAAFEANTATQARPRPLRKPRGGAPIGFPR